MLAFKAHVVLLMAFFAKAKADKPLPPTAGPVYSYYAPYPTTASTEAATSTTPLPPPPPAPYDSYYDSYNSPSQSGGLYYYYYPTANEIDDTNPELDLVETTTEAVAVLEEAAPAVVEKFEFSPLQKLFMIMIGISLVFPAKYNITTVRKRRGKVFFSK